VRLCMSFVHLFSFIRQYFRLFLFKTFLTFSLQAISVGFKDVREFQDNRMGCDFVHWYRFARDPEEPDAITLWCQVIKANSDKSL
jgi:hypothetical protein